MQRKASHSAIERRRRERINDKIMQLKSLVPSCADKPTMHKLAVLEDGIAFILQMREYIAAVSGGVLPEQFVAVPCADAGAGSLDGDDGDDMADGADGDADMGAMDALAAAALRSAPAPMRALPALPPSPSPSASELLDGARSQPAHSPRPVIMALDSILS
ncbi:hypothetical protein HK105_207723 [Polyrhizophydium stewartii]|uniref:BHLH domain-containing protein n=1 Tax=Polyrhizophydium stewartii TaxID=2732419 RepID=A0ABR4MW18_9FUNG